MLEPENKEQKINLDRVAFYGRCFDEYLKFLNLDPAKLVGKKILDCPSGTGSFVAEARLKGIDAVAVDPVLGLPLDEIYSKGKSDIAHVVERARQVPYMYNWDDFFRDYDQLESTRYKSLELFRSDFIEYPNQYRSDSLPKLAMTDGEFDIGLTGHLLFTYSDRLPYDFHLQSLIELVRVCSEEVRAYPLGGLDGKPYSEWNHLVGDLEHLGIGVSLEESSYQFIRGWDKVAVFRRR